MNRDANETEDSNNADWQIASGVNRKRHGPTSTNCDSSPPVVSRKRLNRSSSGLQRTFSHSDLQQASEGNNANSDTVFKQPLAKGSIVVKHTYAEIDDGVPSNQLLNKSLTSNTAEQRAENGKRSMLTGVRTHVESKVDSTTHSAYSRESEKVVQHSSQVRTQYSNSLPEAQRLLGRLAEVQKSLLGIVGREKIASDLFEPHKSEIPLNEYETHFQKMYGDASLLLSSDITANVASNSLGTEQERVDELIELRTIKSQLANNLVRLRVGTALRFDAKMASGLSASYSNLSDVKAVIARNTEAFNAINKSVLGLHYVRILDNVQQRMKVLRDSLPAYRTIYTAVANKRVVDSHKKLNATIRKLTPRCLCSNAI